MPPSSLQMAHSAMVRAPDDTARRITYFERFAASTLVLALQDAGQGDEVSPMTLHADGTPYLLAFETEEDLATYLQHQTEFVTLQGRDVVAMCRGQNVGVAMGLHNPEHAFLIDPETLDWLVQVLMAEGQTIETKITSLHPMTGLTPDELTRLVEQLRTLTGLADHACLLVAKYDDDTTQPVVFFVDALDAAMPILTQTISEYRSFSAIQTDVWDVTFCKTSDPIYAKVSQVGLKLDIPKAEPALQVSIPGADPNKPPILR